MDEGDSVMELEQKIIFVKALVNAVKDEVLAKIDQTPEDWDGHELRQWLADKFADSASMSQMQDKRQSRRRAYENTVIVRNL
jgi:hypothetical protein